MITAPELAARLGTPALRVIDVRWDIEDPEGGRRAYAAGHIPGAAYLHLEEGLSDPDADVAGQLASADHVAAALARAGVGPRDEIVAYDDARIFTAARLRWAAEVLGLAPIEVLDGGWPRWVADALPQSAEDDAPPPGPGPDRRAPRPELVADLEEVKAGGRRLVDCRLDETWRAAGAHIPGAVHLPSSSTIDPDRHTAIDAEAVRERAAAAGLEPDEPLTLYCGGGISATQVWRALSEAGYRDLRVYDGSWAEWSAHDDTPREPH